MERVIIRHVSEPGTQQPADREGRRRYRAQSQRRSDRRPRGQRGHRHPDRPQGDLDLPPGQHARSGPVRAQGARGAALSGRLPGHGRFVPARPVQGPSVVLAVGLLRLAGRRRRSPSTSRRRSRCSPRPATATASRRDGRVQHPALCRHRPVDPGDHGRGRDRRLDPAGRDQRGLPQAPGAQLPDDPDPLEPGLPRPALQCRRLRLQSRQLPTRRS